MTLAVLARARKAPADHPNRLLLSRGRLAAMAFPELREDHLSVLQRFGSEREVEAGEVLFRRGDTAYDFHAIVSGRIGIVLDFEARTSAPSPSTAPVASSASTTS